MKPRLVPPRLGGAASLAVLLAASCGGAPTLPAGWTVTEATAFQQAHDAAIGAFGGPLSTTASYYIDRGQVVALGVVDGAVAVTTAAGGPRIRIDNTGEPAWCTEGCGAEPLSLAERRAATLDRFTLAMGPQSGSIRVLVQDPQAPAMLEHTGLSSFPVDARFIVPARLEPDADRPTVELSTSRGLQKSFVRAGTLTARWEGQPITLVGYQAGPVGTPLLVPFTDATTGEQSYPVGRYLEVEVGDDGVAVLDFNRATNPWCAYSEHYNCPVPPADNRLSHAVLAGERVYAAH